MPDGDYDELSDENLLDDDPIPARRDHRIFSIKVETKKKDKDEDFEEDEFV
ncbi:MAG TPA: hypothetical protein VEC16_04905 [Alphaproteobacteria bacterium]|nr:hypothetical protein [Alphaproteobacteria bacterium]